MIRMLMMKCPLKTVLIYVVIDIVMMLMLIPGHRAMLENPVEIEEKFVIQKRCTEELMALVITSGTVTGVQQTANFCAS